MSGIRRDQLRTKLEFNFESIRVVLKSIKSQLNDDSINNLKEETKILRILFQNKTIAFVNLADLTDYKLVIINDEFLNSRYKLKSKPDNFLVSFRCCLSG